MSETKELATALAQELLGDGEGQDSKFMGALREQVVAQVSPKLDAMSEEIGVLREGLAKGPPQKTEDRVGPAPWHAAGTPHWNQMAAAMGVPDANWYNPKAEGVKVDGKFKDFGEFIRAVVNRDIGRKDDERLQNVKDNGSMAVLTGEEIDLGGALVPEEFRPRLMNMMLQSTSIRSKATVLPMGVPTVSIPAIRDADHSNGTTFGGVDFNWLEVNDQIPESQPDFKLVQLIARALAGRTVLPNTLIQDSFMTVAPLIMTLFQQAVPWVEESVFLRGDGVGKPLGVINSPAVVDAARDTSSEFNVADIYTMQSHLPPGSMMRAAWYINPQVLPQLGTLNAGQVQAWHPSLSASTPGMLSGLPVIWNEHASGLGARGDVMLIDWMYYLIGDRQSLSMDASKDEEFSSNKTVLRAIERLDGTPWVDTPLIPAQRTGTSFTMSPFVVLAA